MNKNREKINVADFLVEIGVEELPANMLTKLADCFAAFVEERLQDVGLKYDVVHSYVTPRRLALLIQNLAAKQEDRVIEKRGPLLSAAYDEDGNPTSACLGFANACGVEVRDLESYKASVGSWVLCRKNEIGASVSELMPGIVTEALRHLPIPKPMRWGEQDFSFIRPVRWVVMLYGEDLLLADIFGIATQRFTYGHRVYAQAAINIPSASQYALILEKSGRVIVDLEERKEIILSELARISRDIGTVIMDEDLLNENAGLTEWPKALRGTFNAEFLKLPAEALQAVMKKHQRCFCLVDDVGRMLPFFIAIANIESKNPESVIKGNERVMGARLCDIQFFYEEDLKYSLDHYAEKLQDAIYQSGLGTLYDKVKRIENLAQFMAEKLGLDVALAKRAAFLSKADLMTDMVRELPELQGVVGYYYALRQHESEPLAIAIKEHYLPRFSGDALPSSDIAAVIALADRIDHITAIFGSNQVPTSDKDPFGLRRAALGVIRIITEKRLSLDLRELLSFAKDNYQDQFQSPIKASIDKIHDFIFERLRGFYLDQGVLSNVFSAVLLRANSSLFDFKLRLDAVRHFQALAESSDLIAAYKRVNNILKKSGLSKDVSCDNSLFVENVERDLAKELEAAEKIIAPLYAEHFYAEALKILAELKPSIDSFFEAVMVMAEDEKVRNNRLALLFKLKNLFSYVADISLL